MQLLDIVAGDLLGAQTRLHDHDICKLMKISSEFLRKAMSKRTGGKYNACGQRKGRSKIGLDAAGQNIAGAYADAVIELVTMSRTSVKNENNRHGPIGTSEKNESNRHGPIEREVAE